MVHIFKSQTLNGMLYLNRNRFGRLTGMLGLLPRALGSCVRKSGHPLQHLPIHPGDALLRNLPLQDIPDFLGGPTILARETLVCGGLHSGQAWFTLRIPEGSEDHPRHEKTKAQKSDVSKVTEPVVEEPGWESCFLSLRPQHGTLSFSWLSVLLTYLMAVDAVLQVCQRGRPIQRRPSPGQHLLLYPFQVPVQLGHLCQEFLSLWVSWS